MTGSQKFALILACGSLVLFVVAVFMFIHGPKVDARSAAPVPVPIIRDKPPIPDPVHVLQEKANMQGIHWNIFCTSYYEGEPDSFQATASVVASSSGLPATHIEEGVTGVWMKSGFTSQEEAATWLYYAIDEAPNVKAWQADKRIRRECVPDIGSKKPVR